MGDSNEIPAVSPETARRMADLIGLDAERAAHATAKEA